MVKMTNFQSKMDFLSANAKFAVQMTEPVQIVIEKN